MDQTTVCSPRSFNDRMCTLSMAHRTLRIDPSSFWKAQFQDKSAMEKTYRIRDPALSHLNCVVSPHNTQQKQRVGRPLGIVNAVGAEEIEFNHLRCCGNDMHLFSVGEEDMLSIGRIRTGLTRIRIYRRICHRTFIFRGVSQGHLSSFEN